ncbi:MAG: Ig-like domain-containing protein [Dehalococcoidales bacterium]
MAELDVARGGSGQVVGGAIGVGVVLAGVVGGMVTFKDGRRVLGVAMFDSNGQAKIIVYTLLLGNHSIIAEYAGSLNFDDSTSSAVTQTVTH